MISNMKVRHIVTSKRIKMILAILIHLSTVGYYICDQLSTPDLMNVKFTPQQQEVFKNIQAYRQQLIFEKLVENTYLSQSFPIVYRTSNPEEFAKPGESTAMETVFYGASGKAKYIKTKEDNYTPNVHYHNGPMTLLFGRTRSWTIAIKFGEHLQNIINIVNFVEHGQEIYACATLDVITANAAYSVEIINDCMFLKDLIYRWATSSRIWMTSYFPKNIPDEAKGAQVVAFYFHRDQPCHFAMAYMDSKRWDAKMIYTIPLKTVTYTPNLDDGDYYDITSVSFKEDHHENLVEMTLTFYSTVFDALIKYYEESNKIYDLKTKIFDEYSPIKIDEFKNSKIDTGGTMWLQGASFKYDATNKLCYIIRSHSILLLTADNVEFFVDGMSSHIKIVIKNTANGDLTCLLGEKFGLLIKDNAIECGIYNVKKN